MKVLFLDIDGVLNHFAFLLGRASHPAMTNDETSGTEWIDPDCVAHLNAIIARSGAKVVISSSWRYVYGPAAMERILRRRGFIGEVIGETQKTNLTRGEEIAAWLKAAPEPVDGFAILDDDTDMAPLGAHQVVTSHATGGLLAEHVEQALAILGEPL